MFLYGEVLKVKLEGIDARRAKHQRRLPVVLTTGEVAELVKEALALFLSLRWLAFWSDTGGTPALPFS